MIFKNFISKVVAFTWFLLLIITFLSCKKAPTDVPEIITKITGKVTDGQTNLSLAGVQIITNPSTSSVITGSDGNYTISNVSPGQYTMTAKKDGYNDNTVTVSVAEGKTVNADIQLMPLGPELAVSVSILDFDVSLTNLSFTITNKSKVGIVTWQISVDQAWLTVTPISGTTTTESDVISVSASRTGLSPGNYAATITINSDYGSKQISVLAVIPNPAAPQLTVIPTTLDFGTSSGGQVLTIKNTGTGNLNWNANPGSTWILLSNNSGSIAPGNSSSVNVSINKSGLVPNNYEGIISITSNGGNQNINVKMIVEAGTLSPPTLQIIGATTQSSITFGWTKVSDPNFASYKIYRSIAPSVNESSTLVTTITDYNQNTYTDNGLSSGTTYYYRVFVYSKSGVGSGSNEVSATTKKVLGTWASNATIPDVSSAYLANSLYPLSENDVWFVYGTKIWHYNGLSWANTFTLSTGSLKAVYFLNENLGWVVGSSGLIYVYNGVTWTKITSSVIGTNFLNDIVAFSENDIWISGQGALFHFDGSNWNKISVAAYSLVDLDFISPNEIWAIENDGKVFRYNGSGWIFIQNLAIGYPSAFRAISVVSANDVWVSCSVNNYGLWHYDGIKFIKDYKLLTGQSYTGRYTVEMLNSTEGWSSSTSYTFAYFDGNEWQAVTSPISSAVYCIKMLNSKSGWAVGSGGQILRYNE